MNALFDAGGPSLMRTRLVGLEMSTRDAAQRVQALAGVVEDIALGHGPVTRDDRDILMNVAGAIRTEADRIDKLGRRCGPLREMLHRWRDAS